MNYWFRASRPEFVFLVAGTVGGIGANSERPADFLYDNMMIHATVVHASHTFGVDKLLYLGSSWLVSTYDWFTRADRVRAATAGSR